MLRSHMRDLGRLLIKLRVYTQKPNSNLQELIDPSLFNLVVNATKEVSGFSSTDGSFNTPSLALRIRHSLKKCCKILEGNTRNC